MILAKIFGLKNDQNFSDLVKVFLYAALFSSVTFIVWVFLYEGDQFLIYFTGPSVSTRFDYLNLLPASLNAIFCALVVAVFLTLSAFSKARAYTFSFMVACAWYLWTRYSGVELDLGFGYILLPLVISIIVIPLVISFLYRGYKKISHRSLKILLLILPFVLLSIPTIYAYQSCSGGGDAYCVAREAVKLNTVEHCENTNGSAMRSLCREKFAELTRDRSLCLEIEPLSPLLERCIKNTDDN